MKEQLQKILDSYRVGVLIQAVEMQRAQPPEEVKAAFDDAVRARGSGAPEERGRGLRQRCHPACPWRRRAMLQEAEGYKAATVARAEGDARRFSAIAGEYVKAPGVTRERLYIETMEQVYSNTTKIFVDQKAGNNLLYLPLDKLVRGATEAGPVAAPPLLSDAAEAVPPLKSGAAGDSRSRTDQRKRTTTP